MQVLEIPKSGGKVRRVYNPDPDLKRQLRALVPQLNLIAEQLDTHHVQHGFTEGRSPVTNAKVHIGWEFTVCFDLENFFDTVTMEMVDNAILSFPGRVVIPPIADCFVHCRAVQGLPTSPALANIAASPMDNEIMALCPKGRFAERPYIYTRYADDLTFSCRTMATVNLLIYEVPRIVERHGFKINAKKTKVQCAKAGRRIITGVAVGEHDIAIPREVRRRIRAGHHQDIAGLRPRNIRRILFSKRKWKKHLPLRNRFYWGLKGLIEWSKLKSPKNEPKPQPTGATGKALTKVVAAMCGQNVATKVGSAWARRFG